MKQAIIDVLPARIAILDMRGVIIAINESWRSFGLEHGRNVINDVGLNYLDICHLAAAQNDPSAQAVGRGIQSILDRALTFFSFKYPCHTAEGEQWFEITAKPLPNDQGGAVISHENITDKINAHYDTKLASKVFSDSYNSILIIDEKYIVRRVNPAFTNTTGYSDKDIVGRTPRFLIARRHDANFFRSIRNSLQRNGFWRGEIWCKRKNGDLCSELLTISEVTSKIDGSKDYICIFTDVTEIKQAEAKLQRVQKLELIGTIASGISHDFNNILTTILGYNQLIMNDISEPTLVAEYVDHIRVAGLRAKELVALIQTFNQQATPERSIVDLAESAREIHRLLERTVPRHIAVTLTLPREPAMILGTTVRLNQVIMNLFMNALEALRGKASGHIAITIQDGTGQWILSVEDDGCGIPSTILSKIFDPFFSTKTDHRGSGLGLSVVSRVVHDCDGDISVQSVEGQGTKFEIAFPKIT